MDGKGKEAKVGVGGISPEDILLESHFSPSSTRVFQRQKHMAVFGRVPGHMGSIWFSGYLMA